MRSIKKLQSYSNRALDAEQQRGAPQSKQEATTRWKRFDKDLTFKQLLIEQLGLCAYTELNIEDFRAENQSQKGAHIEHIAPKSKHYNDTFNYYNLILSALDDDDLTRFKNELFAGHHKDNRYDASLFISPLNTNCRDYFSYSTEDGEIFPRKGLEAIENAKAKYTIKLLNLNVGYLKNKRKNWLKELDEEIEKLIDIGAKHGLAQLAECELCTTARDYPPINSHPIEQLRPFHSASRQLFGPLGDRVMAAHCASCL